MLKVKQIKIVDTEFYMKESILLNEGRIMIFHNKNLRKVCTRRPVHQELKKKKKKSST